MRRGGRGGGKINRFDAQIMVKNIKLVEWDVNILGDGPIRFRMTGAKSYKVIIGLDLVCGVIYEGIRRTGVRVTKAYSQY